MPSDTELLQTTRTRLLTELAEGDIKPSYSIDGESVSWNEYRKSLLDQVEQANKLIQATAGPFTIRSKGRA